jgi:hypothetical protein
MAKCRQYSKAEAEEDRRQKDFPAEGSNGNCRREEYNDLNYHEAASIKRGPKTVCDSNQDS